MSEDLVCIPQVTKESTVVLAVPSCPMIKLDDKHYKLVDKMEALTEAPPSLIACKSLTVKGPVKFVKGVVIKGDVTFENGRYNLTRRPKSCYCKWLPLAAVVLNIQPALAEGKEPVSLEKKTYENTKEKLGQSKQQETAPVGAQPAFA